jgi:hypothetical protein
MNPNPTASTDPIDFPSGTPCERILTKLQQQGDCTKGDLLDASGLPSYTELEAVLRSLEGKISQHWHELGFRTYRLVQGRPTFPPWLPKN